MSEQETDEFVNAPQRRNIAVKAGLVATGAALTGATLLSLSSEAGASTPSTPAGGPVATEAAPTPVNVSDPVTPSTEKAPSPVNVSDPVTPSVHKDKAPTPVNVSDPVYKPAAPKVEAKQATPGDTTVTTMEKTVPVVTASPVVEAPTLPVTTESPVAQVAVNPEAQAPVATSSEASPDTGNTILGDVAGGVIIAGAAGLVGSQIKDRLDKR